LIEYRLLADSFSFIDEGRSKIDASHILNKDVERLAGIKLCFERSLVFLAVNGSKEFRVLVNGHIIPRLSDIQPEFP